VLEYLTGRGAIKSIQIAKFKFYTLLGVLVNRHNITNVNTKGPGGLEIPWPEPASPWFDRTLKNYQILVVSLFDCDVVLSKPVSCAMGANYCMFGLIVPGMSN